MTAEGRFVDADELRRRIEAVRFDEVTPWRRGYRCAQGVTLKVLDAMPSVAAPKGWTRDEVLAELAKHPDNVCEALNPIHNEWEALTSFWIEQWHPEVRRFDVRVVRSTPDPEWVPLTKLVGRTIHGETEPVTSPPAWTAINGKAEWRWLSIPHGKWLPFPEGTLNLETGQVAVRPKAAT